MQNHLLEIIDDSTPSFNKPLIFNNDVDTSNVKNLLLIDSIVSESQLFYDSSNSNTFSVIYSNNSNRNDFIQLLENKFSNGLERIAFVFHDNIKNGKTFLNQELFFLEDGNTNSSNTQLLIDIIKKFGVKNIDFLACNSLNYENWVNFYDLLAKETNVLVGASNNNTGNLKYGGDWVMENTNENVLSTYFNRNIENYASTLSTSIISTSITLTQALIDNGTYTWPVTVTKGTATSPVVITFGENITLNNISQYFIIDSEYITFEGNYKTVIISSVTNYLGLIQNGTSSINGYPNIVINNINFTQIDSSIEINAGWVCQNSFGLNVSYCYVNNCNTDVTCDGNTNYYIGLICGPQANGVICNNCSSAGNIAGGGIFGSFVTNCEANNCYSTGNIGNNSTFTGAGGIYGSNCNNTNKANKCYSTGNIFYSVIFPSGGICGQNSNVNVTNCYSNGLIGLNFRNFSINNCGGIFSGISSGNATNCYSSGLINKGDGIGGTGIQENCYFANNNWSDSSANLALTGTPNSLYTNNPGNIWASIGSTTPANTPYILSSFNSSLYATSTVNNTSLGDYTSSSGLFTPDYNYNLISVNDALVPSNIKINNTSGVLTFTNLTSGTYTQEIFCSKGKAPSYYGYNFNKFTLNQTTSIPGITITSNGGIIYIQQSGNDIQYQSNSTSGTWTNITSFPVTFVNSNPVSGNILTISIITNITIGLATGYFICGSSYITFDGTGKTITIANVSAYLGLIQNGTNLANGYSNIIVKNINNAISGSSTLATSGGWICQSFFGRGVNNIVVDNCTNSGAINGIAAGGICGALTGNNNGIVSITNCSNSGVISSRFAGGICGAGTGQNSGNVSISNCTNNGIISGSPAGGICGRSTGFMNGNVSITNCSNNGAINGSGVGGICGDSAGNNNGTVSITNCSNNGAISGSQSGGMCGNNTGLNSLVSITNCYNTGVISGNFAGGIAGISFGYNNNKLCSIINCYNTGNINGSNAGGITGALVGYNDNVAYTPKVLIQNCYSLGNIATTAGGICGGTFGSSSYRNTPTVNITNCYTVYDSIADFGSQYIATSLPIKNSIILTNVYSSLTSLWSDTNASSALSGALSIYRNSRLYKYYSNFGEVWYSNQNNTPFSFTSNLDNVPRRQIRD